MSDQRQASTCLSSEHRLTPYLRPLHHSETLLINERSEKLAETRTVYRFGFGQSPFPVPKALQQALASHAHEKAYLPVQGLPALRTAVAAFHRREDNVDWQPERVVIGPGSKLLIYSVLAAFRQADVLLVTPSWVSYEPQAYLAGHSVQRLTTNAGNQWLLEPQALATFCASRRADAPPLILILNYPSNPAGTSYSSQQLEALAEVLRRHQVIVISDEIYGLLHHQGEHDSLARYYPEGTLVTGGLSKWCGAGGWRLGILHVPEALWGILKPSLLGVASETWSCVSAPIQHAAIVAYEHGPDIASFVARQRTVLSYIGHTIADQLNAADVATCEPMGGFYLFPDFAAWRDRLAHNGVLCDTQLCEGLLAEAGVAVLPGSAFGYPVNKLTVRLSYVAFDGTAALDEAVTLGQIAEPVMAGIDAILTWLRALPRA